MFTIFMMVTSWSALFLGMTIVIKSIFSKDRGGVL